MEQRLEPAAEVEVEHAHDEANVVVELLCRKRGVHVADVVLLEHRDRLSIGDAGRAERLVVAVVALDGRHAELAHAHLQPPVRSLRDDHDLDAQARELVEHAHGQHVGAAQDHVVAHERVFTARPGR